MSNRQIALVVIIAFFWVLSGIVYVVFIRNVSFLSVTIEWPEVARVTLQKGGADMLAVSCNKTCVLKQIPPFDYTLTVTADGFVPYHETMHITRSSQFSKTISLVRNVHTEDYRMEAVEAIEEIKNKRRILSETGAENTEREFLWSFSGTTYFLERKPQFRLVARSVSDGNEKEEALFESDQMVQVVATSLNSDGLLWLETEGNSTLFDCISETHDFPAFPKGVEKIARISKGNDITAVIAGSVFFFDRTNKTVAKNPLYSDIVLLPDNRIVGLISKGDEAKSSLLNFPDSEKSRVIIDSRAGNRKVVFETEDSLKYLRFESGALLLENDSGEKEILKNYE